MNDKIPSDFSNHDQWLSYVRDNIPVARQSYALACGRTELFKRFYEIRQQTFPVEFAEELKRIGELSDPERTDNLELLNRRILGSLTAFLSDERGPGRRVEADEDIAESARDEIQRLLDHLAEKNPYFALWIAHKQGIEGNFGAQRWEDHLSQELGPESERDIAFTRAMVELDKLLLYFRDRNLPLPEYFFGRCWFLHYLRGPERMLQTRALLNTLTAEIEACASA
jgi:hypothetical protein